MRVFVAGTPVTLGRDHFVGSGGEGTVYARDGVAYKIFFDPAIAPCRSRMAELSAISEPHVIRPLESICDETGQVIGHTLRFLADHIPFCRLFTRVFRDAAGIGPQRIHQLCRNLRQTLAAVHGAGVTVVDLNPMNLLISPDLREVFLIDAGSWQTPSHPATAVLDAVRDRHAKALGPESDWFAFAVVTFQAFIGVHPFRGTHPTVKGLEERMLANLSVFDSQVKIPSICAPLADIPPSWRDWYRRVFEEGLREPPPLWSAVETLDGLPATRVAIGVSPRAGRRVRAEVVDGTLVLTDLRTHKQMPLVLAAREVTSHGGLIAVRSRDKLIHIVLHDVGNTVIASPRVIADVLQNATHLYDGVAIQDLLGATWALVVNQLGHCRRIRLPALDNRRIVDASLAEDGLAITTFRDGTLQRELYRH